jgi:hypothetical protein
MGLIPKRAQRRAAKTLVASTHLGVILSFGFVRLSPRCTAERLVRRAVAVPNPESRLELNMPTTVCWIHVEPNADYAVPGGEIQGNGFQKWPRRSQPPKGNAVKDSWGRFSLHVAVRSANERIFAERKATYLLSKNHALKKVVEEVKTSSSKWMKQADPKNNAGFQWQAGYAGFSVSQSKVPDVRTYIEGQREHHRTITFQDELRALFQRHGIEYDERYVWD